MSINNKKKTGFYDKCYNEINVDDYLLFENGSKYVVLNGEHEIILKSLSINNMPAILLSKITYGNLLSSALILP